MYFLASTWCLEVDGPSTPSAVQLLLESRNESANSLFGSLCTQISATLAFEWFPCIPRCMLCNPLVDDPKENSQMTDTGAVMVTYPNFHKVVVWASSYEHRAKRIRTLDVVVFAFRFIFGDVIVSALQFGNTLPSCSK